MRVQAGLDVFGRSRTSDSTKTRGTWDRENVRFSTSLALDRVSEPWEAAYFRLSVFLAKLSWLLEQISNYYWG